MVDSSRQKKCIRHTLQFREHKPSQQGTAQNVQLIGVLQVMRATCQVRYVKSKDAFKPSQTIDGPEVVGKFKANYFFFIVMEEKGDATSAVTWHRLYLDWCNLSVTTPSI